LRLKAAKPAQRFEQMAKIDSANKSIYKYPMNFIKICNFVLIFLFTFSLQAETLAYQRAKSAKKISNPPNLNTQIIDNFEEHKVGKLPRSWRTWPFQRSKASKVYKVRQENKNRYLSAYDSEDISVQLLYNLNWDVNEFPMLAFRWRAHDLPAGAKESDDNKNDSACGVYVTVGQLSGHALKYVWSSTLPVGKVVSRKNGKLKIKVLASGKSQAKKWKNFKVNVKKDYEQLFNKSLKRNPRLGILTDGNAVHKTASCDYDDFKISRN